MIHIPVVKREPWRTEHEQHRDSGMGLEADIPSMARGLRTVEVAEAVIESANTGLVVELAP